MLYSTHMTRAEPARIRPDLAGRPSLWREAEEKVASLTTRELEVLTLMADGFPSAQIGAVLGISMRTVDIHRGTMLRKLDVKSGPLAVRLAVYAALAQLDCEGHTSA